VDAIMIRSPTGTLTAGGQAIVEVKVWATQAFTMDALDLFAMADAAVGSNPWIHIGTLSPTRPGPQVLWTTYTLRAGTRQAVRAQLRYAGAPPVEPNPGEPEPAQTFLCGEGTFDDRDDLVFEVLPAVLP
jgi:leucyl aminopeptidase